MLGVWRFQVPNCHLASAVSSQSNIIRGQISSILPSPAPLFSSPRRHNTFHQILMVLVAELGDTLLDDTILDDTILDDTILSTKYCWCWCCWQQSWVTWWHEDGAGISALSPTLLDDPSTNLRQPEQSVKNYPYLAIKTDQMCGKLIETDTNWRSTWHGDMRTGDQRPFTYIGNPRLSRKNQMCGTLDETDTNWRSTWYMWLKDIIEEISVLNTGTIHHPTLVRAEWEKLIWQRVHWSW